MITPLRLVLAMALIGSGSIGASLIRNGGKPDSFRLPSFDIRNLPLQLGQWHGEDTPLDPRIAEAVGAHAQITRLYRNADGGAVAVHSAVFANDELYPHPPTVCYPNAGFEIVGETPAQIESGAGRTVHASQMTVQRGEEKLRVLYWYRCGEHTINGTWKVKEVRRTLWGQPTWPAMVKVMLQAPLGENDPGGAELSDLAAQIDRWMVAPGREQP